MRYKADTDAVATWLLSTAVERGYNVAHINNNVEPAVKGTRLKGKARQLARASQPPAGTHGKPITGAYRITINDFIYIANFIAKVNKPRVKVPRQFVLQLRHAIETRKSHQVWYENRCAGTAESIASDSGHAYFISILESVMEILRPIMPTASPRFREDASIGSSPLANMFEHLDVEETLETASHGNAEPKVSAPTRVSATVESTGVGRKHEASIASIFLSRDVHRLRGSIQAIWKDYHEGNVGLVAASITTNTAIDFCRRLQEDFEKAFPGEEKGYERACTYCIFLKDAKTEDFVILQGDGPCLANVHRILERFVDETNDGSPDEPPTVSSAHIHPYLQQTPEGQESGGENNFFSDNNLMMGVLTELCALMRATSPHCERLHAEHEIMRAMRHLLSCKTQTLWLTFAFQILLDIRHTMREDITWAFDDLCRGSKLIASNIEKVLQFSVDAGVTHLSRNQDQVLNQILGQVRRWTEQDLVRDFIDWAAGHGEAWSTAKKHLPPYYLLKRDPLWCGTLLYSFRMLAHEAAITVANSWSCILATAHLYNGFRQSGLLAFRWEDMERVISMHGVENLFVGAAPTTLEDCLKHFSLATGMRPSELAPNQRQAQKEAKSSNLKWRRLKQLTPVSSLFKGRLCEADGRTDLGPNDVIKALRQKALEEGSEAYEISPDVDLCDIIGKLRLAIEHETTQTTFNHFEMHLVCSKLLRQLHEAVAPDIFMWSVEYRDDRSIPGVVLAILVEATKGRPVASKAGELMAGFVALNDDLAQRDTQTLDAVVISRRASASGGGVVGHSDPSHLLVSYANIHN